MSNKNPALSAAYGLVDGFNTSSGTLRLIFDITYNNNQLSMKALHEWSLTCTGATVCTIETLLITGLSLFTNLSPKSHHPLNNFFVSSWAIVRDAYKAFKNAYKGLRALLQTINAASHFNLFNIIIPIWFTMGLLSALNRTGYRQLSDERKKIIKKNAELQQRVRNSNVADCQFSEYANSIHKQSYRSKVLGYLSKAYGGLIDGLYLYMGVAVVVLLTPEMFAMVAWFSTIFVLTCIATRLYEEHTEHRRVVVSENLVKLEIAYQELNALLNTLQNDNNGPCEQVAGRRKIQTFLESRHRVLCGLKLSSSEAILDGLKDGLAIYGALSALVFSVYTITLILSASFPAVLIPIFATFGIICLIGCSLYSYLTNLADTNSKAISDKTLDETLSRLCKTNDFDNIKQIVVKEMDFKQSTSSAIPKYSEVFRSGSSGIGKAPKAVEFALGALQESDENGRYHDSPFMFFLMVPCTVFYVLTLGLTGYRDEFTPKPVSSFSNNLHCFFTARSHHQLDLKQNNISRLH